MEISLLFPDLLEVMIKAESEILLKLLLLESAVATLVVAMLGRSEPCSLSTTYLALGEERVD